MTLEAGKEMDRRCAINWLNEVYITPSRAFDKYTEDELKMFAYDTLVLLKEQEPILLENQHKPYGISTNANSPWISRCPRCDKKIEGKQTRFCKYCGQAVKWDD